MNYQTYLDIDDDEIIDYITMTKRPEDVFFYDELRTWALNNGFIEEG